MGMEVEKEETLRLLRSPSPHPLPPPKQTVPSSMEVSDDVTGPQEAANVEPPVDDTSEVILKITETLEQTDPSVIRPEQESATSDGSSSDVDVKRVVKQTLADCARELAKERESKPE
jgi:hypothetical protein